MRILTVEQMREVDRVTSEERGIGTLTLMENAGAAVAGFCAREFPRIASRRIVVLCGKGNNGGDALAASRHLKAMGASPQVWLLAKPGELRGDAAANRDRWRACGGDLRAASNADEWKAAREVLGEAQIVVDGIFGTGFRGPAEGWVARAIEDVNASRSHAKVLAVDISSGLSSEGGGAPGGAVRADYTVTFTAPKRGQFIGKVQEYVGLLRVAEIGSPADVIESAARDADATVWRWLERGEFASLPLTRRPDSNKGNYGHVLVVAGSRGKSGAAVLCGSAALRAGAGLVTVATPACVQNVVAGAMPELMTAPLSCSGGESISSECLGQFGELVEEKSVVGLGPGLGADPETQEVVRQIVRECPAPMVLDADGLNAFSGRAAELRDHAAPFLAITPHPGEMARLAGCSIAEVQSNRIEIATRYAAQWNVWAILKGYQTVIAAPDGRVWINSTGNPGMATGGTGDVLTGMLTGMVAQFGVKSGVEGWAQALTFGVYLHGLAGDLAAGETAEAPMIASDVVGALPQAWRQVISELEIG